MRRTALIALGFALAACQLNLPTSSSGTTDAAGAGTTGAGGSGGAAAHPCDGKKDCEVCKSCAVHVQCSELATACSQASGCVGIDQCFLNCGSDAECKDQCFLQNPDGEAMYRALQACVYCQACPSDCAGYTTCT